MARDEFITFPIGADFSRLFNERVVSVRGVELCDEEEIEEDDEGVYARMDATTDREQEDEMLKRSAEGILI